MWSGVLPPTAPPVMVMSTLGVVIPAYNPEPFEDKAPSQGPFSAVAGITTPNVDMTITGGAVGGSTPDHIR
jgi:hypothetical protein